MEVLCSQSYNVSFKRNKTLQRARQNAELVSRQLVNIYFYERHDPTLTEPTRPGPAVTLFTY